MSGIVNKVKEAIHGDHTTSTHAGTHTGTHTGNHAGTTGLTGTTGTTGTTGATGYGNGVGATTATGTGPVHSSKVANTLDPRVETVGTTGTTGLTGTHGTTGYSHAGTTGTTGLTGTTGHSHIGNDTAIGAGGVGLGEHHHNKHATTTGAYPNTGTSGGISSSTNAGPHDSSLANKLDPRVDSDLDGRGNRIGASTHTGGVLGVSGSHATPGSGTAQNTAGPHNSDLANKIDPRVDSDLDGSKTIGGNRTSA